MTAQAPLPARIVNEWVYCPRLAILEWVHGEFEHNRYTADGAREHRRVDRPTAALPAADEGADEPFAARSVWLTSDALGLTAKLDVVEGEGDEVWPVDTKRGKVPDVPERAYAPERVQLCAQALLLREAGYRCQRGYLYFAGSRTRVEVVFDDALVALTTQAIADCKAAAERAELPPPLDNSPKCRGCSLSGICLPDETTLLAQLAAPGAKPGTRRLVAPDVPRSPLYVTESDVKIGVSAGRFVVRRRKEKLAEVGVPLTSQISIFGRAQISTQAVRAAADAEIPICWFSFGGYFMAMAKGGWHKNVVLRRAQWRAVEDRGVCLRVARELVAGKIKNQRTLLRRNGVDVDTEALRELKRLASSAMDCDSLASLLGVEGAAAALYFKWFRSMVRTEQAQGWGFDVTGRNRRPPLDPLNALLSYVYGLLTKELTVVADAVGFDPYVGLYHQPKYGKPALALDLMEEFRPLVGDSVVLSVVNRGEVRPGHFVTRATGCALTSDGRRAVLRAYERRLAETMTHPIFDYRVSWRRVIEIQARLLGRHLLGETNRYVPIITR